MAKKKEPEWEFIFVNEPSEEVLAAAHKVFADHLIKKYGVENCKRILAEAKRQQAQET